MEGQNVPNLEMVEVHRSAGVTQTVAGDGRGNPWREGAVVAWKSWRRRSWKRDPGLGAGAGARTWLVEVRTWLSPMAAPCPAVVTGEDEALSGGGAASGGGGSSWAWGGTWCGGGGPSGGCPPEGLGGGGLPHLPRFFPAHYYLPKIRMEGSILYVACRAIAGMT